MKVRAGGFSIIVLNVAGSGTSVPHTTNHKYAQYVEYHRLLDEYARYTRIRNTYRDTVFAVMCTVHFRTTHVPIEKRPAI